MQPREGKGVMASAGNQSQRGTERDFWKQYDEFKMLDKVIPDLRKVAGCYVQVGEQKFAQITDSQVNENTQGGESV